MAGRGQPLAGNCPHGHPYSGSNLYLDPKTGYRACNTCRELVNNKKRWKLYGIDEETEAHLWFLQCGLCAICSSQLTREAAFYGTTGARIDHNHKTNKIRGILCNSCNVGLEQFRDDSRRLRLAADYIDENCN